MASVASEAAAPPPPGTCRNCGHPVSEAYCPHCGQETELRIPSLREFGAELADQYIALEGRLGRTLWRLVRRPGQLTLDYLDGLRQRYVRPFRLYLTLSLLFFLGYGLSTTSAVHVHIQPPSVQAPAGPTRNDGTRQLAPNDAAPKDAAPKPAAQTRSEVADRIPKTGWPYLDRKINAFARLPYDEINRRIRDHLRDYTPYAMFVLMPLSALGLQLVYLGQHRRYGEHLLFVVHLHCFAYLALLLEELFVAGVNALGAHVDSDLASLVIAGYLLLALRRVYGGCWWSTVLRALVLLAGYLVALGLALFGGLILAVVD